MILEMLRKHFLLVLGFLLTLQPASAEEDKIVIAALGDSITAGTPFFLSPLESPPEGQGDPEGQYGYWMMRSHPEWRVINLGIRGQRTDEVRVRFDDAFKDLPRYLIVLAGINDIAQNSSTRAACKNLEWMYQQAKERGVMPIAATLLPYDRASPAQNEEIARVNEWIKEAAQRHRIGFVDLHAAVADAKDPTKLNGTPDGAHPDIGGYRAIGKAFAKEIALFEKARPKTTFNPE